MWARPKYRITHCLFTDCTFFRNNFVNMFKLNFIMRKLCVGEFNIPVDLLQFLFMNVVFVTIQMGEFQGIYQEVDRNLLEVADINNTCGADSSNELSITVY